MLWGIAPGARSPPEFPPSPWTLTPDYGLAVLKGSDPHAPDLALFMLSPEGQQIFAHYGFEPVALPASVR